MSTTNRTLILASASPRRQELIQILPLSVQIIPSELDEHIDTDKPPAEVVQELSLRKANDVYEKWKQKDSQQDSPVIKDNAVIIGSDTIVVQQGNILGKPEDETHAYQMLKALQADTHQVYTGVACLDVKTGQKLVRYRQTDVMMKPLSAAQIKQYIATKEPMDKAGGYGIQGIGATLVERIDGDYFAVVGLPLSLLTDMLKELGFDLI